MNLYRNINMYLNDWITDKIPNKPLIVNGSRQVGKTTTILNFLKNSIFDYVYIDVKADPFWINVFSKKNSKIILDEIQMQFNKNFANKEIVLFIDEIQVYMPFLEILKYFNQDYNELKVIVAGSLLDTKYNDFDFMYPVGKVHTVNMYPMTFEEFLINASEKLHAYLLDLTSEFNLLNGVVNNHHETLHNFYQTYLMTGGMPESVAYYLINRSEKLFNYNNLIAIKNGIYRCYLKDIKDNFSKIESDKATRIYNVIDNQLMKENKRFILADIDLGKNKSKAKMQRYKTTFLKLNSTHIVNELNYINSLSKPLNANLVETSFKLYYNDVGFYSLKHNLININMDNTNHSWLKVRDGITENFANNEILYNLSEFLKIYCYRNSQECRELDFVLEHQSNKIFIFEIDTSENKTSKSFDSISKENSYKCIKVSYKNFSIDENYINIPIYFIGYFVKYCLEKF